MTKLYNIHIFIFLISLFTLLLVLLAPSVGRNTKTGDFIYSLFSHLCHQRAELSLTVFNNQMPVCNRCFGVYSGFFLGYSLACFVFKNQIYKKKWHLLKISIMLALTGWAAIVIDIMMVNKNLYPPDLLIRLSSGSFAGIFSGMLLYYLIEYFIIYIRNRLNP